MKIIAVHEAKTHLYRLLEEVGAGETITITKHGHPIAKLIPIQPAIEPSETIKELRQARRGVLLGKQSIKAIIEEGRP